MIVLEKVSKLYPKPTGVIKALHEIDLIVEKNEFIVIRGPSGSGKTTLLLTIGGMLRPTKGCLTVAGMDPYRVGHKARLDFRAEKIGFVFQLFYLVPYLNVMENVLLPAGLAEGGTRGFRSRARSLLHRLNLENRSTHFPGELSAGEKQRVAIARAMLKKPEIVLADEPTGNLDPENSAVIVNGLAEFHGEGCTVIIVTHGKDCDRYAERIIHLRQGQIRSIQG